MSNYSLLFEKENIRIFKKKNTFKLILDFNTNTNNDIIEQFKNDEIYKILKVLNKDIIEFVKINKKEDDETDISIVLINFENNDDYELNNEKYYISFSKKITIIDDKCIKIEGNKNNIEFIKENFKKLELENINFNINIIDNKINLIIKIEYVNDTLPIYMENYIAKLFAKIFSRFVKYYKNN